MTRGPKAAANRRHVLAISGTLGDGWNMVESGRVGKSDVPQAEGTTAGEPAIWKQCVPGMIS